MRPPFTRTAGSLLCRAPAASSLLSKRAYSAVSSSSSFAYLFLTFQAAEVPAQVTTLPNKVRVATENIPGHFHSVGVYVDAGSRYESNRTSGTSHLLDRLAFKVSVSP